MATWGIFWKFGGVLFEGQTVLFQDGILLTRNLIATAVLSQAETS